MNCNFIKQADASEFNISDQFGPNLGIFSDMPHEYDAFGFKMPQFEPNYDFNFGLVEKQGDNHDSSKYGMEKTSVTSSLQ